MDVWKVCPKLITMNKDCTQYVGYIDTSQGQQFRVQMELLSRGSLKGAQIKCEWELDNLLKDCRHILQQRIDQGSSLRSFLTELQSLVESKLDQRNKIEPSSKMCGQVIQELETLGWNRLVSVDPSFQKFELKTVDRGERTHVIKIHLHPQHPERAPTCQTDLPRHFDLHWSLQGQLEGLYEQFVKSVECYQEFWNQTGEIDLKTWVLEPEKPTFAATHRRIVLSTSVSLQLSIDPLRPQSLPEYRFLGSDQAVKPFQDSFNKNLYLWDESDSLLTNLQRLLQHEFPSPTNTRKEDFSVECGICYTYRLESDIPDKTCDDPRCGQPYHSGCLYEWLRGLSTNQQSFNIVFGECPYCSKPITVKMPNSS